MSAVTIVPGTQSASLARRVASSLRFAVDVTALLHRAPAGARVRLPRPVGAADRAGAASPDSLDDLRNATWEDAEWQ